MILSKPKTYAHLTENRDIQANFKFTANFIYGFSINEKPFLF
jgi:hypothetical protein